VPLKPDVGFVACLDRGVVEAQALLLFESIRRYGGRFADCALYAVSARGRHTISAGARSRLQTLGARHLEPVLEVETPEYGSAHRVAAAAHVEDAGGHEILVILDSDTLFLGEPAELDLPGDVDVAVRPVDVKGLSTSGGADSFDRYWRELCRYGGVDYDAIPWRESFVDRRRIKANYNGGLVAVRGGLGILRRCGDLLFGSLRQGVLPRASADSFRTGAGWIEPAAARLWGSSQAALSVAVWSSTRRVRELPATYNYPLHLHEQLEQALAQSLFRDLVHVHYHWLLAADAVDTNPLFAASEPLRAEQREWLRSATPIG
jgi:hypothetical protein